MREGGDTVGEETEACGGGKGDGVGGGVEAVVKGSKDWVPYEFFSGHGIDLFGGAWNGKS